jgi:hypothetical protein
MVTPQAARIFDQRVKDISLGMLWVLQRVLVQLPHLLMAEELPVLFQVRVLTWSQALLESVVAFREPTVCLEVCMSGALPLGPDSPRDFFLQLCFCGQEEVETPNPAITLEDAGSQHH